MTLGRARARSKVWTRVPCRMRRQPRGSARGEEGQIMVMSLGFMVIAILLIITATMVTALHLDRVRLWDLADETARAGASAIDVDAFYSASGGLRPGEVPISDSSVRGAAQDYLERVQHSFERVAVAKAYTSDGRTAVVELRATSRPGLLGWLAAIGGPQDGVVLRVESSARAW